MTKSFRNLSWASRTLGPKSLALTWDGSTSGHPLPPPAQTLHRGWLRAVTSQWGVELRRGVWNLSFRSSAGNEELTTVLQTTEAWHAEVSVTYPLVPSHSLSDSLAQDPHFLNCMEMTCGHLLGLCPIIPPATPGPRPVPASQQDSVVMACPVRLSTLREDATLQGLPQAWYCSSGAKTEVEALGLNWPDSPYHSSPRPSLPHHHPQAICQGYMAFQNLCP
eukprot:XP_022260474.1 uncharacterized protein LOC111090645 [Canis lupus familiaris]